MSDNPGPEARPGGSREAPARFTDRRIRARSSAPARHALRRPGPPLRLALRLPFGRPPDPLAGPLWSAPSTGLATALRLGGGLQQPELWPGCAPRSTRSRAVREIPTLSPQNRPPSPDRAAQSPTPAPASPGRPQPGWPPAAAGWRPDGRRRRGPEGRLSDRPSRENGRSPPPALRIFFSVAFRFLGSSSGETAPGSGRAVAGTGAVRSPGGGSTAAVRTRRARRRRRPAPPGPARGPARRPSGDAAGG